MTSLAGRYRAAVSALETGNCALWLSFQRSARSRTTVPCDEAARTRLAGWQPTRVARYPPVRVF